MFYNEPEKRDCLSPLQIYENRFDFQNRIIKNYKNFPNDKLTSESDAGVRVFLGRNLEPRRRFVQWHIIFLDKKCCDFVVLQIVCINFALFENIKDLY